MIQKIIHTLVEKNNLSQQEAYETMNAIMSGKVSEPLIASFLTALRMKGETAEEIAGCALAMREKAVKISTKHSTVIDTCGTGGDNSHTFNISTASALVAASCGAIVAKHGNRAISSKSGSADVLKALGVNIEIDKEKVERCLDEIGIAFLFAPMMHGAMKYAAPVRKELGMRTVFNLLGPLTNPAGAKRQLLGVFHSELTEKIAQVLLSLGTERALVVHGAGGLDEISTIGETQISEISNGTIRTYSFHYSSCSIANANLEDLMGSDAVVNAAIMEQIFSGMKSPFSDITALNAGAALYVDGIASSIQDGVVIASEAIATGKAQKKLQELIDFTN